MRADVPFGRCRRHLAAAFVYTGSGPFLPCVLSNIETICRVSEQSISTLRRHSQRRLPASCSSSFARINSERVHSSMRVLSCCWGITAKRIQGTLPRGRCPNANGYLRRIAPRHCFHRRNLNRARVTDHDRSGWRFGGSGGQRASILARMRSAVVIASAIAFSNAGERRSYVDTARAARIEAAIKRTRFLPSSTRGSLARFAICSPLRVHLQQSRIGANFFPFKRRSFLNQHLACSRTPLKVGIVGMCVVLLGKRQRR